MGNGSETQQALLASELSYRRLFEAAQDGILILDVDTGRVTGPSQCSTRPSNPDVRSNPP